MLSKEKLKELLKLKTKKGRIQQGRFMLEGLRLCEEALNSRWEIESILLTASFEDKIRGKDFFEKLQQSKTQLITAKSNDLQKLSDTVTPQGIMCVVRTRRIQIEEMWKINNHFILALDGIRDPGNVGTLIRTADAFGADGMLLSNDTVELLNPKVVRSTMGSIFHFPIWDEVDLEVILPELKKRNFKILGTDVRKGKRLDGFDHSGNICILIGNEAEGLRENLLALADELIHIPIYGKAESLNAAVAGGIVLYEITRKHLHS